MKDQSIHFVQIGLTSVLALALVSSATGAITWTRTFQDVENSTGIGFDDPTHGLARRNTFDSVLSYLNTVLDHTGAGEIEVRESNLTIPETSNTLASASVFFSGSTGFTNGLLFKRITTGVDSTGSAPEARIEYNFGTGGTGVPWNSGLDSPTSSEYDLFSVTLHELTHTLGFLSFLDGDETSADGPDLFSVYDSFLERPDGSKLIDNSTFEYTGADSSDQTTGTLFFDGPETTEANEGTPVEVFTPSTFQPGSSISHLVGVPDAVMTFNIGLGDERRFFTAEDRGVLDDIGYLIQPVPEPSAFLFGGLVCSVFGVKYSRRRRVPTAGAAERVAD